MDYAYKRIGSKGFAETIEAVERSVALHGFSVGQCHDIQGRLQSKGFPIGPLVIFEIAPVGEEADSAMSLIMPCRIHVYEDEGNVIVAALRPTVFAAVFPEHEIDELAAKVEITVVKIVDSAVD
ncbi:MAG: DUF302 domain-containing protein [Coriobacteriia bacterium]|nr:DUF302 domain-containing protein [Coriobacteriia bacterium]MDO9108481.1 DUF302 domain-containing protein [Coriobacteriia bacterium]